MAQRDEGHGIPLPIVTNELAGSIEYFGAKVGLLAETVILHRRISGEAGHYVARWLRARCLCLTLIKFVVNTDFATTG